jgi:hypothetical protein
VHEKGIFSPKQILADIRVGMTDEALLDKYGIDEKDLRNFLQLFILTGAISRKDLYQREIAAEKANNDETEKYRQLFVMAEAAFKNEDDRYNRLEDTAHKYVPVMLFLISAEGYLAKWVIDKLVDPGCWLDGFGIVFITMALAALMASGGLLFRSFRFEDLRLFRPDDEDVNFFDTYELSTIYRAYAVKFNEEREINSQITKKKIEIRKRAYQLIVASFVFMILTGVVFVIHSIQ